MCFDHFPNASHGPSGSACPSFAHVRVGVSRFLHGRGSQGACHLVPCFGHRVEHGLQFLRQLRQLLRQRLHRRTPRLPTVVSRPPDRRVGSIAGSTVQGPLEPASGRYCNQETDGQDATGGSSHGGGGEREGVEAKDQDQEESINWCSCWW